MFNVGQTVEVYNPYGSFTFKSKVTKVSPKEKVVTANNQKYFVKNDNYAERKTSWGIGSIKIIQ